jgi:hypothetical protein
LKSQRSVVHDGLALATSVFGLKSREGG